VCKMNCKYISPIGFKIRILRSGEATVKIHNFGVHEYNIGLSFTGKTKFQLFFFYVMLIMHNVLILTEQCVK
jgi:hypothetical protein